MAGYDERDVAREEAYAPTQTKAMARDRGMLPSVGQETPQGLRRQILSLRTTADNFEKLVETFAGGLEPLLNHYPIDESPALRGLTEANGESEVVASFQHEIARIDDGMSRLRDILDRVQL